MLLVRKVSESSPGGSRVVDGDVGVARGRLDGKVAIVTGAARGQGEAIAQLFAAEGAHVYMLDVLEEEGTRAAKEIGDRATFVAMDISDPDEWTSLVGEVLAQHGTIDVLVNNGALTQLGPLEDISIEEYRRLFEVNELGVFLAMRAVFPAMKAQGRGSIINTASAATIQAVAGQAAYTGTKMHVVGLSRVAAGEWGYHGIRVNALLPGAIDTVMMRGPHTVGVDVDKMMSTNPISRLGQPIEIAYAALYLASDESSYVTGISLPVDGGRSHVRAIPRT